MAAVAITTLLLAFLRPKLVFSLVSLVGGVLLWRRGTFAKMTRMQVSLAVACVVAVGCLVFFGFIPLLYEPSDDDGKLPPHIQLRRDRRHKLRLMIPEPSVAC